MALISFVVIIAFIQSARSQLSEQFDLDRAASLGAVDAAIEDAAVAYRNGDGSAYDDSDFSKDGERISSAYKHLEDFDKALQGQHEAEGHRGFYNELGRKVAGKNDESSYYSKADAALRGRKGADYAENSKYNKGSKTTGHHKVYHKDEYKKDRKFYDESQSSGHLNRYGDYDAAQRVAKGGNASGGKYSAALEEGSFGEKGFVDRGAREDSLRGHTGATGYDGYYNNQEKQASNGGAVVAQNYGYDN